MHNGLVRMRAIGLYAAAFLAISFQSLAGEKPASKSPKKYKSPIEVFDAYRAAIESQDWQAAFSCETQKLQEDHLFEMLLYCGENRSAPEGPVLLKKFGIDAAAISAAYNKRYKAKHGVDLDQLQAEHDKRMKKSIANAPVDDQVKHARQEAPGDSAANGNSRPAPPKPPYDEDLLRQVSLDRIVDKTAFYAEAAAVIYRKGSDLTGFTELQELSIKDDTATGQTTVFQYYFDKELGRNMIECGESADSTCHFRKSGGGWLIERWEPTVHDTTPSSDSGR